MIEMMSRERSDSDSTLRLVTYIIVVDLDLVGAAFFVSTWFALVSTLSVGC